MSGRAALNTVHAFFVDRFPAGKTALLSSLEGTLNEPFDVAERRESEAILAKIVAAGGAVADA